MANKKSTSRIIDEMGATMRGLDRCGVPNTKELAKFIRGTEEKTKLRKSFNQIKEGKSRPSE